MKKNKSKETKRNIRKQFQSENSIWCKLTILSARIHSAADPITIPKHPNQATSAYSWSWYYPPDSMPPVIYKRYSIYDHTRPIISRNTTSTNYEITFKYTYHEIINYVTQAEWISFNFIQCNKLPTYLSIDNKWQIVNSEISRNVELLLPHLHQNLQSKFNKILILNNACGFWYS